MLQKLKIIVDNIANWLESIGFILTIFTAIKIYFFNKKLIALDKKHLFQVRIQEHIADLKNISKTISNLISNFNNNKVTLKAEIKKSEEIAKSIKKKLDKKDIDNTTLLIKAAKAIEKLPENIENVSRIQKAYFKVINRVEFNEKIMNSYYIQLSGLITSLEELKKDNSKTLRP